MSTIKPGRSPIRTARASTDLRARLLEPESIALGELCERAARARREQQVEVRDEAVLVVELGREGLPTVADDALDRRQRPATSGSSSSSRSRARRTDSLSMRTVSHPSGTTSAKDPSWSAKRSKPSGTVGQLESGLLGSTAGPTRPARRRRRHLPHGLITTTTGREQDGR